MEEGEGGGAPLIACPRERLTCLPACLALLGEERPGCGGAPSAPWDPREVTSCARRPPHPGPLGPHMSSPRGRSL